MKTQEITDEYFKNKPERHKLSKTEAKELLVLIEREKKDESSK